LSLCPLVIDLDGTLLNSDLLIESGVAFARAEPFKVFSLLGWLVSCGKAQLKEQLALKVEVDVTTLPYNAQLVEFIEEERRKGREIVLATATHRLYAEQIATHLGIFDRVIATNKETNLSGRNKRDRLIEQFGEKGFDYVGNSHDDLVVWAAARRAYVVNPAPGVVVKAKALGNVEGVFDAPRERVRLWIKGMRFHQWIKNLLIFVPLLASHQVGRPELLLNGLAAFLFFGLCASSVYLLNDVLDLPDDRRHPSKRHRPFASGHVSIKSGLLAIPVLFLSAFVGALWLLPWEFTASLAVYYVLTLVYSIWLKRLIMVDVVVLALLYTLRVVAGTFVFGGVLTFWMLAFSMFIFLSLALVKRYAELKEARNKGETEKTGGRGYYPDDLEMISSLGGSAGYLSIMVLALYIQDPNTVVLYHHPQVIWLACPLLLFWVSRIWLLTHRGHMHDDPVVFAIKDRVSLLVGMLFGAIFWAAT